MAAGRCEKWPDVFSHPPPSPWSSCPANTGDLAESCPSSSGFPGASKQLVPIRGPHHCCWGGQTAPSFGDLASMGPVQEPCAHSA